MKVFIASCFALFAVAQAAAITTPAAADAIRAPVSETALLVARGPPQVNGNTKEVNDRLRRLGEQLKEKDKHMDKMTPEEKEAHASQWSHVSHAIGPGAPTKLRGPSPEWYKEIAKHNPGVTPPNEDKKEEPKKKKH